VGFVWRMAIRETRSAWKRLAFFFLCLAIGVGSIITIRSVLTAVRHTLTREARTALGADIRISTNRPWDSKVVSAIARELASVPALQRTEEIETLSMVRPARRQEALAHLAELRGVQAGFPLYGSLQLEGGRTFSHAMLREHGVLVRPDLLAQLGVAVGDEVLIGEQRFTIRGVIAAEPGRRAGVFSLGSRVVLDLEDLRNTGLVAYGSRANDRVLLRLRESDVDRVASQLRRAFTGQFVSVRSFRAAEDNVSDHLSRTENYLSLVGLVIVMLGGVGVWSVVRVFVRQKLKSVAVLKCVGATSRQVLLVYVTQVMLMGAAGALAGVGVAAAALAWVQPLVERVAGVGVPYLLTWSAAGQGIGIGLLVSLLFALVPLLDVRHVRPSLLLRFTDEIRPVRDAVHYSVILVVGGALLGLAAWQAGSSRVGMVLAAGLTAVGLVLHGASWMVVRMIGPLQSSPHFALRYAARRVARPGNQTRAILLAVGLGAFLVVGVRALEANLLREFNLERRPDTPDMVLIDVQSDQRLALERFLAGAGSGVRGRATFLPVLRARMTGVAGRPLNPERQEDGRGHSPFGHEYVVTYRDHLERNETVTAGSFWAKGPERDAEVSIEDSLPSRVGIGIGDTVQFDVMGRAIEAKVTSIRRVNWADAAAGGFMFVFRPGVLDAAPKTFVVPLRGPVGDVARARLQGEIAQRFSNVTAIDVQEVLANVATVVDMVTTAITVVGGLVVFSGLLILAGSISMTKYQRAYEAAVLKTLGATTPLLATMLVFEFGLLGLVAGVVGSTTALALTWAICRFALDTVWHAEWGVVLAGLMASIALVTVVGLTASLDVLRRKPLGTLRAE
jgi:putative ABC transport system permease protein